MLRDGHAVHILARNESAFWRLEGILDGLRIHHADLRDRERVCKAVSDIRPEWVFHLAVYGAYSYQTDRQEILCNNVLGTANLLEACEKTDFAAFINTGSSSEYGFKSHLPAEDEPLEPNSDYAVSKASATLLCSYTGRRIGRPIITLRLYSVYGAYEEPRRLIPRLLRLGLASRLPALVSPEIARDYVYIDDVVEAYLKAATTPGLSNGAIFNIGSGAQTCLAEVVQLVRELLCISAEPVWDSMQRRIWDTETWVGNVEKAARDLGWTPRTSLQAGLAATLEWLRDHLAHYPLDL
jgi:nucleoside-diphosphate-sugar epimerase